MLKVIIFAEKYGNHGGLHLGFGSRRMGKGEQFFWNSRPNGVSIAHLNLGGSGFMLPQDILNIPRSLLVHFPTRNCSDNTSFQVMFSKISRGRVAKF